QQGVRVTRWYQDRSVTELLGVLSQKPDQTDFIILQVKTRDFDRVPRGAERIVLTKYARVDCHAALCERSYRGDASDGVAKNDRRHRGLRSASISGHCGGRGRNRGVLSVVFMLAR